MRSPLALAKREQRFKGGSLQPEMQREAGLRPRSPSAGMPRATSTPKLLDQAGDGVGELPLSAVHQVCLQVSMQYSLAACHLHPPSSCLIRLGKAGELNLGCTCCAFDGIAG